MKIAVILPTRGLVFTEVENAIEEMRQRYEIEVFRSWNWGIPLAQNQLVLQALEINPDYLLFIEEDTIPPDNALELLTSGDPDISFIDYGVGGWSCSAKMEDSDEILWCGFGCTLVKREVFERMENPWFRTDKSLRLNDWTWIDVPMKYGGQDIWFCCKARELGFKITQVLGECRHMKIDALGTAEINQGRHLLSQKPVIEKYQIIEKPDEDLLTKDPRLDNVETLGNNPHGV